MQKKTIRISKAYLKDLISASFGWILILGSFLTLVLGLEHSILLAPELGSVVEHPALGSLGFTSHVFGLLGGVMIFKRRYLPLPAIGFLFLASAPTLILHISPPLYRLYRPEYPLFFYLISFIALLGFVYLLADRQRFVGRVTSRGFLFLLLTVGACLIIGYFLPWLYLLTK